MGKTISSSAFIQLLQRNQGIRGPFLVVCPLSVLVNWQRELLAWTDLDVVIYHGSQDDRKVIYDSEFLYTGKTKADGYKIEIVITTPDTCMNTDTPSSNSRLLTKINWELVIIDEAHLLKNHDSKISTTLRNDFTYRNCLLLTGTPLQNNTDELWSLLNFVDRNEFDDREDFVDKFGDMKTADQLELLQSKLKPYLLRREKEHVEKSVPIKTEVVIEVEMTVPQKQYYRALYEQKTGFLYRGGSKDRPQLTNLAMELRKTCNHPFLIKGARAEITKHFCSDNEVDLLVNTSGKLILLDKLLPKLQADGHKVLIFSQFRMMLNILEDYLAMKSFSYERVDGTITGRKRQAAVDRYMGRNAMPNVSTDYFAMLLSTRAGGVGINLTAADTVIIFDSDWNPQNDIQAQARAHRIGQTKPVTVYRLLTRKTYEMAMFQAASMKLGLDYAVMHNMRGPISDATKESNEESADTRVSKRFTRSSVQDSILSSFVDSMKTGDNYSALSKREIENLLKFGAYDIFREEKDGQTSEESKRFIDEEIDEILKRSSVVIHNGEKKATTESEIQAEKLSTGFAKASFVSSTGTSDNIAVDDPDFWNKVVGLSVDDQNNDSYYGGKRKCRDYVTSYREPDMKSLLYARKSADDENDSGSDEDQDNEVDDSINVPVELTSPNLKKLLTTLVVRGYGNFIQIRKESKLHWAVKNISRICRHLILNLLILSSLNVSESDISTEGSNDVSVPIAEQNSIKEITYDFNYLENYLKSHHASRLALGSWMKELNLDFSQVLDDETIEDNEVMTRCQHFVSSDSSIQLPQTLSFLFANQLNASLQTNGTVDFLSDDIIKQFIVNNVPIETEKDEVKVDEQSGNQEVGFISFLKAFIAKFKATTILPVDFITFDVDRIEKVRLKSRERLNQIEEIFSVTMLSTLVMFHASIYPLESITDEIGEKKFQVELMEGLMKELNTSCTDEAFASTWLPSYDAFLMHELDHIGWPEGKRKLSALETSLNQYFNLQEKIIVPSNVETVDSDANSLTLASDDKVMQNTYKLNNKFVIKRIRELNSSFRKKYSLLLKEQIHAAKQMKKTEQQAEECAKKLVSTVLHSIQKFGRPHLVFESMKEQKIAVFEQFLLTWEGFLMTLGSQYSREVVEPIIKAFIDAHNNYISDVTIDIASVSFLYNSIMKLS